MTGKYETTVQKEVMLDMVNRGGLAWRNNVGAAVDHSGNHVRYGLANISKKMNKKLKSSDVIGVTTVVITPDMVGKKVGIITAIEVKKEGWERSPTNEREEAQENFHNIVKEAGGIAGFVQSVEDLFEIRRKYFHVIR